MAAVLICDSSTHTMAAGKARITLSEICDMHCGIFREKYIIKELIECMVDVKKHME